jgi:hypothetical protein
MLGSNLPSNTRVEGYFEGLRPPDHGRPLAEPVRRASSTFCRPGTSSVFLAAYGFGLR